MTSLATMFRLSGFGFPSSLSFTPHRIGPFAGLPSDSRNSARSARIGSMTSTGFAARAVFGAVVLGSPFTAGLNPLVIDIAKWVD
jgi:hypothetical protein